VETPGLKQLQDKKKENEPTTPKFGLPPSLGDVIVKQKPSLRRKHVFFDILIEGEKDLSGRIVFELFNDIVPITVENFKCFCTGERGMGKRHKLTFEGSSFHRIVKGQLIQGGDLAIGLQNGECIYGRSFDDENFLVNHSSAGLLSMANTGPNTNSSQFFITLDKLPHLDNKHVVFGKVIDGLNIVRNIGDIQVAVGEKPLKKAMVVRCGEIQIIGDQAEMEAEKYQKEKEERERRRIELEATLKKETSTVIEEVAEAVQEGLKRRKNVQPSEEHLPKRKRKNFMSYGDPALDGLFDDE